MAGEGARPAPAGGAGPDVVDMLLGQRGSQRVVDHETLIKEIQKRVWSALKTGYKYSGVVEESEAFLRPRVFKRMNMVVMYVDLVGSTTMALEMSEDKLATLISSFALEMAYVVRQFGGMVLKFVGDAVLGYFVGSPSELQAADKSVACAGSMLAAIDEGINPILNQYDYSDLRVKIGIDYGQVIVVRYGDDAERSPVDLLGPPMNIAAKIQSLARPGEVLVGEDVYSRLHPSVREGFEEASPDPASWRYRSRATGDIYRVYRPRRRAGPGPQG